jgi:2-methylisocitrate lyase-like PEP mutase family enzyme
VSHAAALRELIARPEILVLPGASDALAAVIIERSGLPAVYASGAGFANVSYGVPDIGLISFDAVLEHMRRIADVVSIPLIVDADTGYGGVLNVARTVRQLERAGAAAIQLEDQVSPKRCGHFDGQGVIPKEEMLAKLAAAMDARNDAVIIARTDARTAEGFEQAIERGNAYAEAGAEIVFVEAPQTREELEALPKAIPVPLLANMVEGGLTPISPATELEAMGFRVALFANTTMRVASYAVRKCVQHLADTGSTDGLLAEMLGWDERQDLVRLDEAQRAEEGYYATARERRPS